MPEEKRRIIDEDQTLTINPDDLIYLDSVTNGSRVISYADLCNAVSATLGIANIKSTADGAMQISNYDKNRDGVVDNASALENHKAEYFASADDLKKVKETVNKAMLKSVYDKDDDGVVDNAMKVDGHTVSVDVPPQAQFTDTIYDDTGLKTEVTNTKKTADETASKLAALGLVVVDGKLNAVWYT